MEGLPIDRYINRSFFTESLLYQSDFGLGGLMVQNFCLGQGKKRRYSCVMTRLFNAEMASKTESKNPKPLCFGYKLNFQQENAQTNVRLV